MVLFELISYKFFIHCLTIAVSFLTLAEVQPVKFSSDSFLVLQFKDSYRREQQRKERESNTARKRRAVSSSKEEFSVRFRTRNANGLLLLASDSTTTVVSGYTVLEVSAIAAFKQYFTTMLKVVIIVEYFLLGFIFLYPPIRAMFSRNPRYVFPRALRFIPSHVFPPVACFPPLSRVPWAKYLLFSLRVLFALSSLD